ncbi:hypothetical protein PM082_016710 [Marasmius tenuissimus]|nr:hypothetical protein PM082_016710 [Marasmius tenuissimus]
MLPVLMSPLRFVVVAAALLHQATAMVIPAGALHELGRRAINCPQGGKSPCVCDGKLGIKVSENKCPDGKFVFSNPTDLNSGEMERVAGGRDAGLQCDHLVEAQFVAKAFVDGSPMCDHFLNGAKGKEDFKAFKDVLNTAKNGNFVFLDTTVNNAKGKFIAGKSFNGAKKIALGVASYLKKTRSDAGKAAKALKDEMDRIAAGAPEEFESFNASFANDYDKLIQGAIDAAEARAKDLKAVAPPPPKPPAQTAGKKRPAPDAASSSPAKKAKTTANQATTKSTTTPGTAKTSGKVTPAQKAPAAGKKGAVKKTPAAGKKKKN